MGFNISKIDSFLFHCLRAHRWPDTRSQRAEDSRVKRDDRWTNGHRVAPSLLKISYSEISLLGTQQGAGFFSVAVFGPASAMQDLREVRKRSGK